MRRTCGFIFRTSITLIFVFVFCAHHSAQASCAGGQIFNSGNCRGDEISTEEKNLIEIINKYRVANGRSEVQNSSSLSMVANRRMLDLRQNLKRLTHSWSNCSYDIKDQKTWPCVADAPQRLNSGYNGQGYETLFRTSFGRATPVAALDAWKKSPPHNSIILNDGMFKDLSWEEFGVAIDGEFAALWFGSKDSFAKRAESSGVGLGISYDQTVKGLSRLFSIDQTSSTVESNRWQGISADKKLRLEIYGTKKEVSETNLAVIIKLDSTGTLDARSKLAISTLLNNFFPEWSDRDAWVIASFAAILADRSATRTKLIRKIAVEMKADGQSAVRLAIFPESKPRYVEIY